MNRVIRILISAVQISLSTFLFSYSTFAETLTIRASKLDFPATFIKGDQWQGMDIAVIKELFLRAELNYQIVERPFKRSLAQIKNGKIALIPNLVKNEKRSAYMDWLGPVRVTCIGLVVLKKDQKMPIKTIDDLIKVAQQKKKKIGYLSGASYSKLFDERLINDPVLTEVLYMLNDSTLKIKMLKAGRMIGYFSDEFEVRQRILNKEFSLEYKDLALHPYSIEQSCTGAYFGLSKTLDKMHYQKLNTAFQSMKHDETFDKIHVKWVGFKPTF